MVNEESPGPDSTAAQPLFRVVAGHPAHEEVAALAAALAVKRAAATRARSTAGRPAASAWPSRSRLLRAPLRPGPDAWRRSSLPG